MNSEIYKRYYNKHRDEILQKRKIQYERKRDYYINNAMQFYYKKVGKEHVDNYLLKQEYNRLKKISIKIFR